MLGGKALKYYTVNEILTLLHEDGWIVKNQEGSHIHFIHPRKKGKVTVPFHGRNKVLKPKTVKAILIQSELIMQEN